MTAPAGDCNRPPPIPSFHSVNANSLHLGAGGGNLPSLQVPTSYRSGRCVRWPVPPYRQSVLQHAAEA